jgi:hypothetical protein
MSGMLLSERPARIARAVVVVLLVVDAVLMAAGPVAVGGGIAAAAVLALVAIMLTINLRNISEVGVTKDGITFKTHVEQAQVAAAEAPAEEESPEERDISVTGGELTKLRLKLEAKLSYIAGNMGLESGNVSIGSLNYDGYLTDEEAATADLLLHTSEAEFATAPRHERDKFLKAAETLVHNIRASVLAGMVQNELKRQGWKVERARGGKRDLLARRDGRSARVVPVFSVVASGDLVDKVARRVAGSRDADRRMIVLPNNTRAPLSSDGDPAVVRVGDLADALTR